MKILKNFLVFEGCEGSGKSTQARCAAGALQKRGHKVWLTKEPGGTPYAEKIRNLILFEKPSDGIDPLTEFLLFEADRREHVQEIIRRHTMGEIIICDRFSFSTFAYQGYGRKLFPERRAFMEAVDAEVRQGIYPWLIFLFDQDVAVGLSRKKNQGDENQFENEKIEFHQRVRDGFLDLARRDDTHHWHTIDAHRSVEKIHDEIMSILEKSH
ncbi:MAG: dTMP kinase [Patescibacteria group bacterium]